MKPYYENDYGALYFGDCKDILPELEPNSIDLVLTDPPYKKTSCKWDSIIPLAPMWKELHRIVKQNGAVIFSASQPFTSKLIMSNLRDFRYCWVWDKVIGTGFLNANKMPLKGYEDIVVFYSRLPVYNPQKIPGKPFIDKRDNKTKIRENKEYLGTKPLPTFQHNTGDRHPRSIVRISSRNNKPLHPTQKPVALMEYFLKTYSNPGMVVLDFATGSGTTAIACENTNRRWICIEKYEKYCKIAKTRIENRPVKIKQQGVRCNAK